MKNQQMATARAERHALLIGLLALLLGAAGTVSVAEPSIAAPAAPAAPSTPAPMRGEILGEASEEFVVTTSLQGHARFESRRLQNRGALLLRGGPTTIQGALANAGTLDLAHSRADVLGATHSSGLIRVTEGQMHFHAPLALDGAYLSDPSDNHFTDLIIGTSGYLVGGAGDRFFVSGDLISSSANSTQWNTLAAELHFTTGTDTLHAFSITGRDRGPVRFARNENFAWGRLEIASGNSLSLVDGNTTPGGALYAGEVGGASLAGSTVSNIAGADSINIYYDPTLPANAYLGGLSYSLGTSGQLGPWSLQALPVLDPVLRFTLALLMAGMGISLARVRIGSAARARRSNGCLSNL